MNTPNQPHNTVWFITGASSGFGEEQAKLLLSRGYKVAVTSRDVSDVEHFVNEYPESALALPLDVLKEDQIVSAVRETKDRFGRIDVLHNNAGYGSFGAMEEYNRDEIIRQFDVNLFGLIRLTQEVLPIMREQESGTIINMSSVAGRVAFPGFGMYSATKHALEGFSKGLAQEVEPFGIRVSLVEPGIFRTDFGGRSLMKVDRKIEAYAPAKKQVEDRIMAAYDNFDDSQGDPARAAQAILKISEMKDVPLYLALGIDAYENIGKQLDAERSALNTYGDLTKATAYKSKTNILEDDLVNA